MPHTKLIADARFKAEARDKQGDMSAYRMYRNLADALEASEARAAHAERVIDAAFAALVEAQHLIDSEFNGIEGMTTEEEVALAVAKWLVHPDAAEWAAPVRTAIAAAARAALNQEEPRDGHKDG